LEHAEKRFKKSEKIIKIANSINLGDSDLEGSGANDLKSSFSLNQSDFEKRNIKNFVKLKKPSPKPPQKIRLDICEKFAKRIHINR
jgi:hypothetical protein